METEAELREAMGPAVPLLFLGEVHWGWIIKTIGGRMIVTACGLASTCTRPKARLAERVKCRLCRIKEREDPELIRGGAKDEA